MLPFVKFLHFQNRVSKRHKKYQMVSKSNLTVQFINGARLEGLVQMVKFRMLYQALKKLARCLV